MQKKNGRQQLIKYGSTEKSDLISLYRKFDNQSKRKNNQGKYGQI